MMCENTTSELCLSKTIFCVYLEQFYVYLEQYLCSECSSLLLYYLTLSTNYNLYPF